jgi:hypothetical protein
MTQETLLDNSNEDEIIIDQSKDYLAEYVGEGKKYKSPADLAKAYFHAESALRNRELRMDQIREDYVKLQAENAAKARLEDLIGQLDDRRKQPTSSEQPNANEVKRPDFDPEQLDSLVSNKIVEIETKRKQQENFNTVKAKLTERFGKNFQTVLKDHIDQLGLTEEDVNALARKSPAALFKTLGLEDNRKETFNAPPRSNVQFRPKVESANKPLSYWQDYRKKNPLAYHDPKIAIQMDKDMQVLGEAFFDVPE